MQYFRTTKREVPAVDDYVRKRAGSGGDGRGTTQQKLGHKLAGLKCMERSTADQVRLAGDVLLVGHSKRLVVHKSLHGRQGDALSDVRIVNRKGARSVAVWVAMAFALFS